MKVTLKSWSKPFEDNFDGDTKSLEEMVEYYARVSNPSAQGMPDTSRRLIKYLARNKHWSPFEMVSACMEVETTRDIAHQILRHRSLFFQEFSQRYADPTGDLGFTIREARLQDHKNRQNSIETDDEDLQSAWAAKQHKIIHEAKLAYQWAIDNGIAKEQARVVLPEGNTNSRLYIHGTLRSWIHYVEVRSANGTQKEHMDVAYQCADVLRPIFPTIDEFIEIRRGQRLEEESKY